MKYVRKYLRMMFLMSVGSPALYVSSYLLTVEAYLEKASGASPQTVAHYSVGGRAAQQFFGPLHKLDTQIRTKYWQK
jgi:hypothetical protein